MNRDKISDVKAHLVKSLLFVFLALVSACSSSKPKRIGEPGPKKDIPVIYHQVRYAGETIALISRWYTGDAKNWHSLAEVNPDIDVNRIFLDDVIRIPKALTVRTDSYNQSQFRAMQRGASGISAGMGLDLAPDVGYPEPGEPGLEPAGEKAPAAVKQQQKVESKNRRNVRPLDAEAAEKRRELQEKTRYELLQQMISEEDK